MANTNRLLNIRNNNSELDKFFKSIAMKYDSRLGINTPVPNHALATELNANGRPATLYFSENAYRMLQFIRNIDHQVSSLRASVGIADQPLEFVCYGYRDFAGDIMIENIDAPILEMMNKLEFDDNNKRLEYLAYYSKQFAKDSHIETTSRMYDFLKNLTLTEPAVGQEVVALYGTTKPPIGEKTSNCFTIKELADAVIPNVPVAGRISTGILAITPKLIEFGRLMREDGNNLSDYLKDGSLECAMISYAMSEKTKKVTPINITNVTQARAIWDSKTHDVQISQSKQPTNVYRVKEDEHTM